MGICFLKQNFDHSIQFVQTKLIMNIIKPETQTLKALMTENILSGKEKQKQMAGSAIQTENKVQVCLAQFDNRDDYPPGQNIKETVNHKI